MLEVVDETAAKILLAASPGDSINRVAGKVDGTYSWVHEWVGRLEERGFIEVDDGIRIADYDARDRFADLVAAISRCDPPTVAEAYVLPNFATMPFAFAKIDAVYCWTDGGYQVGRSDADYPVFVRVLDRDLGRWEAFFASHGVPTTVERRPARDEFDRAVRFVLSPVDDLDPEWVGGRPVVSLEETVEHALAHRAQYEPALELLAEERSVDLDFDPNHHRDSTGADA